MNTRSRIGLRPRYPFCDHQGDTMILIGEAVINEDVATELREAVASRIEELKKAVKVMEKAKLDPHEPEGKIEVLRTLDRLMDPQADWEAEQRAGSQKDVSEVEGWNETTRREIADAFDVPAEPEAIEGWGEGDEAVIQRVGARLNGEAIPEDEQAEGTDDGARYVVVEHPSGAGGVIYSVLDREQDFTVAKGIEDRAEAEQLAADNNDFVASLASVHDLDAPATTPSLPEENEPDEGEPEGMILTDPFAEPEEEDEEERDELADARKRELQNALLEEMAFEPEPTEEAGDEDAVQPAPEGPYYVEKVDAGFFQVRSREAVRCTRDTLPDAEAARDRLNRQAVATEAPATL